MKVIVKEGCPEVYPAKQDGLDVFCCERMVRAWGREVDCFGDKYAVPPTIVEPSRVFAPPLHTPYSIDFCPFCGAAIERTSEELP